MDYMPKFKYRAIKFVDENEKNHCDLGLTNISQIL